MNLPKYVFFSAPRNGRGAEALLVIFFIVVLVICHASSSPGTCGEASDCYKYSMMAKAFRSGAGMAIEYPFGHRVLSPLIASAISANVSNGFAWLNLLSEILFVVICLPIAKTLKISLWGYSAICLWFVLHPIGFPLYWAVPVSPDPLYYALVAATCLSYLRKSFRLLPVLLLMGMLTKETFVFIALIIVIAILAIDMKIARVIRMLVIGSPRTELLLVIGKRGQMLALGAGGIIISILVYFFIKLEFIDTFFPVLQPYTVGSLATIRWFADEALKDPWRLVVWASSGFAATGYSLLLVASRIITKYAPPTRSRLVDPVFYAICLLLSASFLAFGLLAGSDMSRIIFNGNVFILLCALMSIDRGKMAEGGVLVVFVGSGLMASLYTRFFPATFEYGYYMTRSIGSSLGFLLLNLVVSFFVLKLLQERPRLNS
jgi:hypothetical protein